MNHRSAVWRLAISRMLAATGANAVNTAIVYTLYAETGSTLWTSVFFVVTFASYGLLTPLAGALADRVDRRRLVLVSEGLTALAYVLLALVASPAAVVAVAALAAVTSAPVLSATRAAVPNLVPPEDLTWANGAVARAFGASLVLGPAIGGVLLVPVGAPGVALGSAAMALVAAMLVASITVPFQSADEDGGDEHGGVRAGIALVWRDPVLRAIVIAEFVAFTGVGFAIVADAPLARAFDVGPVGYAALVVTWGCGMLVGSYLAGRLDDPRRELPFVVAGMTMMGLGLVLVWAMPWFGAILALITLGGCGMGVVEVARQGVIQRRTPDVVRGRVFAAAEAVGGIAFSSSLVLAGAVVGAVGAQPSYAMAGATHLVAVGLIIVLLARAGAMLVHRNKPAEV